MSEIRVTRITTDKQLQTIAEILIGCCDKDIDEICEQEGFPPFNSWTQLDCMAFDELAFRCAKCEWWVGGDDHGSEEAEEEAGNFVCSECGGEN